MEVKKTSKASLENERTTFFLLGFVVALSSLFVIIEWQSEEFISPDWDGFSTLFIEEELIESPEAISLESHNSELTQEESKLIEEQNEPEIAEPDPSSAYNVVDELTEAEEIELDDLEREMLENPQTIKMEISFVAPRQKENEGEEDIVYIEADKMPQFKGGYTELVRFIYNRLEYPSIALKQRIQGRVWSSFIINKDGTVSDIKIEQGVYFSLDEEAIRVLKMMPSWEPGTINSESVRVKIYLPIVFKL